MRSLDEHEDGSVSGVGTDVLSESLVVAESVVGLADGEHNFTLVVLSGLRESSFSGDGSFVVVCEEEDSRVLLLEDFLDRTVVEWHNEGERVRVDESLQTFAGHLTGVVVATLIEVLVQNDLFSLLFKSEVLVENVSEGNIFIAHSDRLEDTHSRLFIAST